MKKLLSLLLLFSSVQLFSQQPIKLWPAGKMPNDNGVVIQDSIVGDHIFHVANPTVYAYLAPKEKNTGAAILIVPGGGYLRLPGSYNKVASALFYQSMGINAFVVCHRLPSSPNVISPEKAPAQDIQRAIRIIYANAGKWGIDTARIGVTGTSAGGHGASTLGTHQEDLSKIGDSLDKYPYKPAFMVLVSAVISFKEGIAHKGSRDRLIGLNPSEKLVTDYSNENRVTKETPPTLLIHSDNDRTVPSLNSIVFYQALKKAGVSASMHIFPYGAHGLTVNKNPGSANMWPAITLEWLREMKFIP